jgi:antitoxin (DNA-binding transcriptional repressor) of toxin-antitoxin stability system
MQFGGSNTNIGSLLAKLVSISRKRHRRKPGGWKGRVVIRRDFDAPLPRAIRDAFAVRD